MTQNVNFRTVHSTNIYLEELNAKAIQYNFSVSKIDFLPELDIVFSDLYHNKSGARYIHLGTDDQNNSFSVALKTPAYDSTGLQHVLEHLSLCGSQNYPCRDPFFKMLSRSISTFMNAMTCKIQINYIDPDFTIYPFTTTNEKDFYNLANVYTDAVFKPLLKPLDFLQEGWRFEHENPCDKSTSIVFKGVVLNEMKGQYSSNLTQYMYSFCKNILPCSYAHENGGHPLSIPNLTYEKVKSYHAAFYHPVNSCFMSYGSISLEKHLKFLDSILKSYDKMPVNSSVIDEPYWMNTKRIVEYCAPDPLLPDHNKQITLTPHIGLDYSPLIGYLDFTKHRVMAVGLKGIGEDDIEKVEIIIKKTFENVLMFLSFLYHREGFEEEHVSDLINTLELKFKHISTKRGLDFLLHTSSLWCHDFSPVDGIRFQFLLNRFKQDYDINPGILCEFLKKEILENTHKITHIFKPNEDYKSKIDRELNSLLKARLETLNQDDQDKIYDQGLELKKNQEESKLENIDTLPVIKLTDMNRKQYSYEVNQLCIGELQNILKQGHVPVQFCIRPTGGVTYFNCLLNVSNLPYILKSYLPLFCAILTDIGAGNYNHKEFSSRKKKFVRGMQASIQIVPHHTNPRDVNEQVSFIKRLAETKDTLDIVEKFQSIASLILDSGNMKCAINTAQDNTEAATRDISNFIDLIPTSTQQQPFVKEFSPRSVKKFIKMPFDVNYIGQALPGVPYNHPDYPSEKGGAYGVGLIHQDQTLRFFSYRDPNISSTIEAFETSSEWIRSGKFTDDDLEEAKVKLLAKLDTPLSPSEHGQLMFITSITHDMMQKLRDRIFEYTREHVIATSDKYLVNDLSSIVIIGSNSNQAPGDEWEIEDLSI
ncbi:hypothetical protein HZS_342 [Henneguya salminicola]|nr:hypothetical protein HZS_342 [Henneguya salminicola]